MNIKVYAIGGQWNPGPSGDCYIGTANDSATLLSLIDLVESKGGYYVSLHGPIVSGEYSLKDARNFANEQKNNMTSCEDYGQYGTDTPMFEDYYGGE